MYISRVILYENRIVLGRWGPQTDFLKCLVFLMLEVEGREDYYYCIYASTCTVRRIPQVGGMP